MTEPRRAAVAPAPPPCVEQVFGDRTAWAERYATVLATTGVDHGLVGPREIPRIWERHVLNCGVVADLLPSGVRVADVGSGAGLPGLVWALARPDLEMHLVEPLLRRTRWLDATIDDLGLDNVTVHRGRAEAMAGVLEVEVVTARAVARLDELAAWCLPLLAPRGRMLALKGSAAQDELDEAAGLLRDMGAVSTDLVECGTGVVDPPTRVVRIELGDRRAAAPPRPGGGARRPSGRRRRGDRARG